MTDEKLGILPHSSLVFLQCWTGHVAASQFQSVRPYYLLVVAACLRTAIVLIAIEHTLLVPRQYARFKVEISSSEE